MPRAFRLPIDLGSAYRIERELGGGGMSRVFLATEIALGRPVAVKVLPPELSQGVSQERFRREIQTAASLQHPHIVPLLAAGDAGGALYYTMPMVDGESLRARLQRDDALSISHTVRVLQNVAEALAYAHSRGVVHRDIKPDNILLVNDSHAVVVDFGVAKAITSARDADLPEPHVGEATLTSAGIALGTPSYMAPEQAAADPDADHRMDIYAVGALGYEMLCGEPLFAGLSPASVLAAQVSIRPEPLEREAHVPESLYAVVERCLEKRPADRYASAAQLVRALADVQADLMMSTASHGRARVATGLSGWRRPRWRTVAEVLVVLLAIGGFSSFVLRGFARGVVDVANSRERDAVLVATFADNGSGLGAVVSDALRTDLTQSPLVRVVQPIAVRDALERMQRAGSSAVDSVLAREVALREGIPVYVLGEVVPVGGGFQLTARLISTDSGFVRAAVRASSADSAGLIEAIDQLSKGLREKLGESLRDLGSAPPLARVTTSSLGALQRYTQAVEAIDGQGDYQRGYRLLDEAITMDTTFAMAMRKLAATLANRGQQPERARNLLEQAMRHRDRLTPLEGFLLEGTWYSSPGPQRNQRRAMNAYDAVLALDSTDTPALNNLAILYMDRADYARAELLLERAVRGVANAFQFSNLVEAQTAQGKFVDARATVSLFRARFPTHPLAHTAAAGVAYAMGDLDGAESALRGLRRLGNEDMGVRRMADGALAALLLMRGRLAESDSTLTAYMRADREIDSHMVMAIETRRAISRVWFMGDQRGAVQQLDVLSRNLAQRPDSGTRAHSPVLMLARGYALSGRVTRSRELLRDFRRGLPRNDSSAMVPLAFAEAEVALQLQDYPRAVQLVQSLPTFGKCPECLSGEQARVFDLAGATDSALVYYTTFVHSMRWDRLEEDAFLLAPAFKRLGELHEERGQKEQAADYYARFLQVFARADAELQPQIAAVRQRLARLRPV